MTDKPRTPPQNNSLNGSLRRYATLLNDSGYEYVTAIEIAHKNGLAVSWTRENLKDFFDAVTQAMYHKTSSELTTVEIQEAWKVFEWKMAQMSGVNCPWFCKEELINKARGE